MKQEGQEQEDKDEWLFDYVGLVTGDTDVRR